MMTFSLGAPSSATGERDTEETLQFDPSEGGPRARERDPAPPQPGLLSSSLQGGQASPRARGVREPASAVRHHLDPDCFHFVNQCLASHSCSQARVPPYITPGGASVVPPEGRTGRRGSATSKDRGSPVSEKGDCALD